MHFPASQEQLDYILDKFHLGRDELRKAGVLDADRDYFAIKMPTHPGGLGHGD